MINVDAIKLMEWQFLQPYPFAPNRRTYATNMSVFSFLKQEFQKGPVYDNYLFRWGFSSFYGMGIVPDSAQTAFYSKMEKLRYQHDNQNARTLTEELQVAMGKNYFSFITKMLNLLDDEAYPIYDSQVAIVFQRPFTPEESTFDHKEAIYQDILDTYRALRDHPVIEEFRAHIDCQGIGYMKILDTIFWCLGAMLDADGLELTPGEFLREHGL